MRKFRITQPIRSSSRSQTRAHAYRVAASAEPAAIEGVGLIEEIHCFYSQFSIKVPSRETIVGVTNINCRARRPRHVMRTIIPCRIIIRQTRRERRRRG